MWKHGSDIALLFTFALTCLNVEAQQNNSQSGAPRNDPIPEITVVSQPDSPLSVDTSASRWAMPSHEIFDMHIVVKNRNTKPVRAYTARLELGYSQKSQEMCYIQNIYFPGKVIKQDETDGKTRFLGFAKDLPPPPVQVFIDYVEFTDGSTWGRDKCQSAESLAGERAGGEAALKFLRTMLQENGVQAVVQTIRSGGPKVEQPDNQSARWNEAFSRGVEHVGYSVIEAYQKEGEPEVGVILSKPYDASGTRQ
ncbi:MAG TPA: hypothetical protein VKB46_02120 [Pyrinomonadaceae bacterium]|nr:hypothetical protein [Pyrinomonadaceae bacterium]